MSQCAIHFFFGRATAKISEDVPTFGMVCCGRMTHVHAGAHGHTHKYTHYAKSSRNMYALVCELPTGG